MLSDGYGMNEYVRTASNLRFVLMYTKENRRSAGVWSCEYGGAWVKSWNWPAFYLVFGPGLDGYFFRADWGHFQIQMSPNDGTWPYMGQKRGQKGPFSGSKWAVEACWRVKT